MRTIAIMLFVLTAVALACKGGVGDVSATQEIYGFECKANSSLPPDAVELISYYPYDALFHVKPTEKSELVTPTMVLVRVYKKYPSGMRFCGWLWMEQRDVTRLHHEVTANTI